MNRILLALFLLLMSPAMEAKPHPQTETAIFAGGCFWCMQPPFEQLEGVTEVLAGYTGGKGANPTYEDYVAKGHTEAVQIKYDPAKVSYSKLLDVFWRNINPTDPDGQFADRGPGYYAAVYYLNDGQKKEAEKSKEALNHSGKFDKPVLTKILKAGPFTAAEGYHQGYSHKNALHYKLYKNGSGRQGFLDQTWGDGGH
jgi:peptide methionine sulfoxide reductase msrA/msrB